MNRHKLQAINRYLKHHLQHSLGSCCNHRNQWHFKWETNPTFLLHLFAFVLFLLFSLGFPEIFLHGAWSLIQLPISLFFKFGIVLFIPNSVLNFGEKKCEK